MPTDLNPYRQGVEANAANHVALTPIDFLTSGADVFPERVAVIHGSLRQTSEQSRERACRLASALTARGIGVGDTVAALLPTEEAFRGGWFHTGDSGGSQDLNRQDPEALVAHEGRVGASDRLIRVPADSGRAARHQYNLRPC